MFNTLTYLRETASETWSPVGPYASLHCSPHSPGATGLVTTATLRQRSRKLQTPPGQPLHQLLLILLLGEGITCSGRFTLWEFWVLLGPGQFLKGHWRYKDSQHLVGITLVSFDITTTLSGRYKNIDKVPKLPSLEVMAFRSQTQIYNILKLPFKNL